MYQNWSKHNCNFLLYKLLQVFASIANVIKQMYEIMPKWIILHLTPLAWLTKLYCNSVMYPKMQ